MANLYLANRLDALRRAQNPDGGWSYYAGKQNSWLEPTVYAALALHGEPAADKAWALVRSWELPDGGWKAAGNVPEANWTSSLALLLATVRGVALPVATKRLEKSVRSGGWAWKDESAPAAEPTAWTVLSLALVGGAPETIVAARGFLDSQPLLPETCGLTLAASAGATELKDVASAWVAEAKSAEIRAKLTLGLRLHAVDLPDNETASLPKNLAVLALEALAAHEGRHRLLKREAA